MNIATLVAAIGLLGLLLLVLFPMALPALYIIAGVMFFVGVLRTTIPEVNPQEEQAHSS